MPEKSSAEQMEEFMMSLDTFAITLTSSEFDNFCRNVYGWLYREKGDVIFAWHRTCKRAF